MELVTGRAGSPHITAQQDRQLHQGIWGEDAYILATGNQLEPQVQSSNKILIKDGALMFQGALFSVKVGTTDEITINNGNQGMQRKDLVVARYTFDSSRNIESAEWVVIQGEPVESDPVTPTGTSGDIQAGDATVDCPFMIVNLDGINVTGVDIIPDIVPDIPTLNASLLSILQPTFEEIYNSSLGTVWGAKIGRLAILKFAILATNATIRTIRLGSKYAPAANAALLLTRNGELLERSWFSKNTSTGVAELEYSAKSGVDQTYTGWAIYITQS